MNALLESLLVPDGTSWTYFHRRLDDSIPFLWHYHEEFELTLTLNSRGTRYVGDCVEPYGDGDLVLLGSNLPHTWMSKDRVCEAAPHVAHVLWIRPDWVREVVDRLVELRPLGALLAKAHRGIVFPESTSCQVQQCMEGMNEATPSQRVVRFVRTLALLSEAPDPRVMCAPRVDHVAPNAADRPRIERTLAHIHKHYRCDIPIPQLASIAALSVSGLHRLFKRHTRLTVGEYITQLRIGKACALLVSTDKPIRCIADEVGYTNPSHFNRQFLSVKSVTPRDFRRTFLAAGRQQAPSAAPKREPSR
jgi:AraC-like DNA-binding protein